MKVAVTGASGFIGKHVLRALLQYPVEIIAVTRNANKLAEFNQKIKIVEIDISSARPDYFEQLECPDVLIHLAWDGLPNYKSSYHLETELPRQLTFLKSMIQAGLPSLIVSGTCLEYGLRLGCLSEDMATNPTNPYGLAKDQLRQQLECLRLLKPFNFIWARLFYMYGEGQSNTSLYPKLKESVLRGDKVFNMSGGEQLRDYLAVTEVANKIIRLAFTQRSIGVVNVCSGEFVSVRSLVEAWLEENGWEIKLNLGFYPYVDYEPIAFWGDIEKLNEVLKEV